MRLTIARAKEWLAALDETLPNRQDFPDEAEVFERQRDTLCELIAINAELLAALKAVIANHCGNEALFCSTCTPTRALITKAEAH